jgi:hypothetical protein
MPDVNVSNQNEKKNRYMIDAFGINTRAIAGRLPGQAQFELSVVTEA